MIDCQARTTGTRARHRLDPDPDGPSMRRVEQAGAGAVHDSGALNDEQRALLDRHVDAFDRYDVDSLVSLMR